MRRTTSSGQPTAVASGKAGLWTSPVRFRQAGAQSSALKPLNSPSPNILHMLRPLSFSAHFISSWLPSTARDQFDLNSLHQTRHSATVTPSGLQKPAVQSVHSQAARKHADLRPLFPVLDAKLGQREIQQRELKVRGKALLEVNHSDLSI
jgi:hypothetical protein